VSYILLAKQHKINLVPFLLEGVAGKPSLIQDDGLHPVAAAQPALLDNVWLQLKGLVK
jgi:acyl-CoA thioesterase I